VVGGDRTGGEFQEWPELGEDEGVDQPADPVGALEDPGSGVTGQVGGQPQPRGPVSITAGSSASSRSSPRSM